MEAVYRIDFVFFYFLHDTLSIGVSLRAIQTRLHRRLDCVLLYRSSQVIAENKIHILIGIGHQIQGSCDFSLHQVVNLYRNMCKGRILLSMFGQTSLQIHRF